MNLKQTRGRPLLPRGPFSSDAFRAACAKRRLTGKAVAESLGCSDQAVYSWRSDRTRPDDATVQRMAELLKVSVRVLRGEN